LDALKGLGFLLNQLRHVLGQCLAYRLQFFLLQLLLKEELLRFLLHGLGLDPLGLNILLGFTGDAVEAERDRFLKPLGADVAFFLD